MRNAECGITVSATASAAVRRALAPNIWPGDKRIGLHARDAKPTTRASLAAPEAGPLPSQFSHGAIRANLDLADVFENPAGDHVPKSNRVNAKSMSRVSECQSLPLPGGLSLRNASSKLVISFGQASSYVKPSKDKITPFSIHKMKSAPFLSPGIFAETSAIMNLLFLGSFLVEARRANRVKKPEPVNSLFETVAEASCSLMTSKTRLFPISIFSNTAFSRRVNGWLFTAPAIHQKSSE